MMTIATVHQRSYKAAIMRFMPSSVLTLLSLGLGYGSAGAQEATDTALANVCQQRAQIASTHQPDSLYQSAVLDLRECDVSGPPILAALWSIASSDSVTRGLLASVTPALRDARLLDTLIAIVKRASAPPAARLAAMRALVGYFDPGIDVAPSRLASPDTIWGLSGLSHRGAINGSQPLPSSHRTTIAAAMKTVASADGNAQIRNAAGFLRRELYWISPASTPLSAEAVGLSYVCGNRFRLRNWDNIPLMLRYRVGETADSGTISIQPRPAGQQYRELTFTTKLKGTVRLRHLTTLLQTTANGGKTCD